MSWHLSVRSMSAALVVSMLVGLLLLSPALALAAPSHTPPPTASSVLTILPDGSLSNTSAPVSVHGLYYSLTAGLTGSIVIERSGAILNGTNHTVTYASGGNGFAVTVTAPYVTVEWVRAAGAPNGGVSVSGAQYVAIKNNNLAQAGSPANSILVTSGNYDSITSNSLGVTAASAVEVLGSTGFNISSNVVGTGAGYAFDIEGSTSFTVWNNAASGTGGAYFYNDMNFAVSTNNFAKGYGYSSQTGQGIVSFDNLNGNFSFNNVQNNSFALTSTGDVGGSFYANTFRYVDPSPGLGALGGINFQGDTGVLFQSNSVVNILQVYVLQSTGTTISGNTISGNSGAGIYLDTATSTAITSNTISNVPYGVEVVDASVGTSITSNVFTNNPDAIYGQGSSSFTITSNTVSASSGYPIDLINSNAVDVEMNTLGGTYYSYFYNQSGLTFMNNTVSHAGGLIAQNVWGTVIVSYNTFTSDSQFSIAAVQVFYGQTAIVSDNTISGATGAAGLFLGSNSFVIADANSVTGTASGPALVLSGTSDGAMITDNTLANSYGGISVTNSSWNMITNNSILSDTHYSFSLTQNSLHNWIYHNTFVADTNWVIDATSTANWFNATYPTGGNFWANDTGPDVHSGATVPQTTGGSDGIVDAPFSHGYVTDNYPLVNHYAVRTLTFYGTGIASSGTWGVRVTWNPLGNQNQTTTTTLMLTGPGNITFSVTAGGYQPYNYSVLPPAGANVTPRNGGGVITTTSQTIGLAFTQQTYTVTFTETGLTSGTSWSVNLSGVKHTSITATISFTEINGTYAFTVPGIAGHWRIPSSGSVTVAGAAVTKAIQWGFNPPYTVTFSVPANLPGGSWWNVSFNGLTLSTQSSTIVFTVSANGTYRYEVQAPSFTFGQIFLPLWGNATVNGASISIATPNLLFEGTLSFELQGLPSGLQYWVVVVGTNGAYYYNETITGFAPALPQHTGSATPVYANFTNAPAGGNGGAFAYTVLVGGSRTQVASGTATLSTIAPGPVMVNLASSLNQIVFMPTGLTAQSWGVTVNGATQTGAGDNPVSFTELNGTYTYSVSPPSGFHVVPSSGTLTVSGGVSTPVDLTFSPIIQPTYAVTFTESGLTSGTSWSVTFNGATQSSSTDSIVFSGIP
ncbi:MAG: right-handed parallel beta-helix repeat-containing protein, partial [Thermoplasmata archaeon]